jgi:hypothetical protein
MSEETKKVMNSELSADERLVWFGRPRTGIRLTAADVYLIPISLGVCGFAIFWELSVWERGPQWKVIWGIPFIAFGLYLVFGRFIVDAIRRQRIFYGLTPRRAIIVSGLFNRKVRSLVLDSICEISVTERPDHSGTISLGTPIVANGWSPRMMSPSWPGAAKYLPPSFEMIENAKKVYEQIGEHRRANEAGG